MIAAARDHWRYRGGERPAFAEEPGPGQRSVWDFPRPPVIEPVPEPLRVRAAGELLAETRTGVRVLETAGAPTYYFPPDAVRREWLTPSGGTSHCEWKGAAEGFLCNLPGMAADREAAWRYRAVYPEFESIAGWFAFYPAVVDCFVGDCQARPQPGGFYGGWVTPELLGPFKGEPGTGAW
jgi:uncharacterized protein (DUF427 family)